MAVLFISDLHLSPERPDITQAFLGFLQEQTQDAEALYILGDFFEVWVGDDAMDEFEDTIAQALRQLNRRGTAIYLLHGNRDFMVGQRFCQRSGCQLLKGHSVLVPLYGQPILLMHGDTLCTRDISYQRKRWRLRNPVSVWLLRNLPLSTRLQIAKRLRQASCTYTRAQATDIVDVTPKAVEQAMQKHRVQVLVHGHTHRPAVHNLNINGQPAKRIVLGDWDQQGWVLKVTKADDFQLLPISF